jgi:predicted secreted protein
MKLCPSRADARLWAERLEDRRSKKVVFLSHCLLNENTRYLGGACRRGCVEEIVQSCLESGLGMVQMPCPEQKAWGGVLKRRLLFFYGSKGTLRYRLRAIVLPVMLWYTRRIYRRLAQETANQIQDYKESGIATLGIIGVDGSPSCGVHKTLNMREALDKIGRLERDSATAREVNRIISGTVTAGQGMYIELLRQEVGKRGLNIPLTFHDLIDELEGRFSSASVQAIIGTDS